MKFKSQFPIETGRWTFYAAPLYTWSGIVGTNRSDHPPPPVLHKTHIFALNSEKIYKHLQIRFLEQFLWQCYIYKHEVASLLLGKNSFS